MAIVAGIIIAIAAGATYVAVSTQEGAPMPPTNNGGNNTNSEPRQIVVELNESLNVDAK